VSSPLASFTSPPRFPDREHTRRAEIIHRVVLYSLAISALGIATLPLLSWNRAPVLASYAFFVASTLATHVFNRRGALVWSVGSIVLGIFCATTFSVAAHGGVYSMPMLAYPILIFGAGLIASGRAALIATAASSIAILAVALAQQRGWLPQAPETAPLDAWIWFTLMGISALAVLNVALRDIHGSSEDTERSERQLRESIEQSPDGIISLDDRYRVTSVNRAAEAILGRARYDLIGEIVSNAQLVNSDEASQLAAILSRAGAGEAPNPREFGIERPDGDSASAEINARRVHHTGERPAVQLTLRDVTERRRLEREKNALELERQHAQRLEAIGKLAGGIAHDFNNYLMVILGSCELLDADLEPASEEAETVRDISSAAMHSAQLTRQLLAFSRQQTLEPRVICANELIETLDPMLRRLLGEQIRIHTLLDASPSGVFVDPSQLEVALINLAVNARDAMPDGGDLTLETDRVALGADAAVALGLEPRPHVRIAVSDCGSGIDETIHDHIFEPFFTTKASGEGTGLGLATVYGIVRQSDGAIRVESEPGRGARFEILLPARETPADLEAGGASARVPLGSQGRILLVEDEASLRKIVRSMLESRGFEVVEAEDGRAALKRIAAERDRISAVLSDVVMPELGGLELSDRLERGAPELPMVLMSGYPQEQLIAQERESKCQILAKPFSREQLVEALNAAIARAAK
jgi:PAS domain S-box-containing protein